MKDQRTASSRQRAWPDGDERRDDLHGAWSATMGRRRRGGATDVPGAVLARRGHRVRRLRDRRGDRCVRDGARDRSARRPPGRRRDHLDGLGGVLDGRRRRLRRHPRQGRRRPPARASRPQRSARSGACSRCAGSSPPTSCWPSATLVGLALFVVPGVVIFTMWSLVGPVITIEDRSVRLGVRAARGSSSARTSGSRCASSRCRCRSNRRSCTRSTTPTSSSTRSCRRSC